MRFLILIALCAAAVLLVGCGSPADAPADAPGAPLTTAVSSFDEGNVLLAAGRYREAIDAYDRATTAGMHSAELHYNTALAYYRLDVLGDAMLHLERARRLAPDERTVLHGISIVESHREDTFSELPEPFTIRFHRGLMRFMGPVGWFLVGFLLLATYTAIRVAGPERGLSPEWLRRARAVTAVPAAVIILYAFVASINPPVADTAVVTARELTVREQPADDSSEIVRIHEALVVELVTAADDWTLIRLPNGTTGWVPAGGLTRV